MDSEEVLIMGVDTNTECLCMGRNKAEKGKQAANPTRRRLKKEVKITDQRENFLVILDDNAKSEDGVEESYIEVYNKSQKSGGAAARKRKRVGYSPEGGGGGGGGGGTDDTRECILDKAPKVAIIDAALQRHPVGVSLQEHAGVTLIQEHLQSDIAIVDTAPVSTALPSELLCVTTTTSSASTTTTTTHPSTAPPTNQQHINGSHQHHDEVNTVTVFTPPPVEPTLVGTPSSRGGAPSLSKPADSGNKQRTPTCWTNCPNCPPSKKRNYHLIDVAYDSAEWSVVSSPLTNIGYSVNRVQRIQNDSLWQRLCYEKQLMLRERADVNEQLLYHTSRTSVPIICEEGLDLRLSMNGNFGCGIYFSDNPLKCNSYWSGGVTMRYMFCCRVLLGAVKLYPKGKCERLRREPPKENPSPGELKFYDSVMGNLTGQNEFVVYNAYRVMPEYVLHYVHTKGTGHVAPPISNVFPGGFNNATLFPAQILPSRITKKKRKSGGRKKK